MKYEVINLQLLDLYFVLAKMQIYISVCNLALVVEKGNTVQGTEDPAVSTL